MTTPTRGNFSHDDVPGIDNLRSALEDMHTSDDPVKQLSDILMHGHEGVTGYLTFGNNKIAKNTGILNFNSATDCPNADSSADNPTETGACQVPWSDCYAHQSEQTYDNALKKRRLQEYLWDSVPADLLADAILHVKERKRSPFEFLRLCQSGDFRHRSDIIKAERIAEKIAPEIKTYTYSASHKLDWSEADTLVINQSNDLADYGDRSFGAVAEPSDVPEGNVLCPFEAAKHNGIATEDRPKCGDCTMCIEPQEDQPRDVSVLIH